MTAGWDLVVHLFAQPDDDDGYLRLRKLWDGCARRLGMTEAIPPSGLPADPPPGRPGPATDVALAARQDVPGDRQCVLRSIGGFPNLSLAFTGSEPGDWARATRLWDEASAGRTDALLGAVRVHLARVPRLGAAPDPETARDLAALRGVAEPTGPRWYDWGALTAGGHHLWEPTADQTTGVRRDFVVAAAASDEREVSAWLWSEGSTRPPPFARYLLNAAKIRHQVRLWESSRRPRSRIERLTASFVRDPGPRSETVPGLAELRQGQADLIAVGGDLADMRTAVQAAAENIVRALPAEREAGPIHADLELAGWFTAQLDADAAAVTAGQERMDRLIGLAAEPRDRPRDAEESPAELPQADVRRRVFVVHGRDQRLRDAIFDFLRGLDLRPMEWEQLVRLSGGTSPFLGDVVAQAPTHTQAALVIISPDDVVTLHPDLHTHEEYPYEVEPACQPRPNVLVELGMALATYPERTVILQIGRIKPIADIAGRNYIQFDGSAAALGKVAERLKAAGCAIDDTAADWRDPARFSVLTAYGRRPPS